MGRGFCGPNFGGIWIIIIIILLLFFFIGEETVTTL